MQRTVGTPSAIGRPLLGGATARRTSPRRHTASDRHSAVGICASDSALMPSALSGIPQAKDGRCWRPALKRNCAPTWH